MIPTDRSLTGSDDANTNTPILDLIGQAQKNRPELLETDIDLVNRQVSGKTPAMRCSRRCHLSVFTVARASEDWLRRQRRPACP